ncbi:hypothetical protein GCM10025880_58480 [Methylorubrum aminovorans]|nr:hypothetical protein GCM10025880_58480 [Methylorubrum aminovorans]
MSDRRDRNEIAAALRQCKTAFVGVAVISGLVNILYLTGSFFMLEVYDRVIPSRSVPTLIGLAALALALYAFQGVLEAIRGRILARIGASLDESLSGRVFDLVVRAPLKGVTQGTASCPCATSTRSAPSCPAPARRPSSICRGCRSIWRSASCSIR